MILLPIQTNPEGNRQFANNPECVAILNVYVDYYKKVGYNPPWIGYFATINGKNIVGCGGYKGGPKGNKVEIAYGTFQNFGNQGVATQICRELLLLALNTDPSVRVTARTLPEKNASGTVLRKNGFNLMGTVYDEDDGNVWEWEYFRHF